MSASDQSSTPVSSLKSGNIRLKDFRRRFDSVEVIADQLLPADRRFAVSNGHPTSHKKLNEGPEQRHFVQLYLNLVWQD